MYAVQQARRLPTPYKMWALVPVFFGVQQGFEGAVWQALDAENISAAVSYALGFHFFSHFLWLWWLPLCCYLVEPKKLEQNNQASPSNKIDKIRRSIIAGCAIFGAFAGTLVYSVMLSHPEWMSTSVNMHSIDYDFSVPWRSALHLPITPAALYALTILLPLFLSGQKFIKIFGGLTALSMVLTSESYSYAYVSLWCFFAAVLSLYLVYMTRHLVVTGVNVPTQH